jgi:Cd2+/Zn2+-exporting ATPase
LWFAAFCGNFAAIFIKLGLGNYDLSGVNLFGSCFTLCLDGGNYANVIIGNCQWCEGGILFKSGAQLELMGKVKAIAFDKTGTLTTGKLQVIQIIAVTGQSESRVLQIAAAIEAYSEHPIGQAISQYAQQQNLQLPIATKVKAEVGYGVSGKVENQLVLVGKTTFVENQKLAVAVGVEAKLGGESLNYLQIQAQQLEVAGNTVVWVSYGGQVMGIIAIADTPRPAAAATIKRLKDLGIAQIVMLTGDNEGTAQSVAQQLGIEQVFAELLPEDKVNIIRRLQRQYQTVAMVGDGINDAPALAQASVGIAMGVAGSNVALETADIVLMADRLDKLEQAIILGRRSQRIVKQNITFALSFILLLLVANFMGNITMPLGVIGHEGSTVLVTLSGLRMLRS